MGRAYVRVSPEILIELLSGPVYVQKPNGSFHRITSSMPQDAKAIRAWPAPTCIIGQHGDVCCAFDSDTITNTPGEMMQEFRVTVQSVRGFSFVRDDGSV